jgi:ubiquinone biosynthesis protein COQ9
MTTTTSDLAQKRDAVLLAMLPEVPFDGWSSTVLRAAAARAEVDDSELVALFPKGMRDIVAWFSRWADRETLKRLAARRDLGQVRGRDRMALAVNTRLAVLLPHREAVRRAFSFLALPQNAPLAAQLLYGTVDMLWRAAGDRSTDFNFYTKRGMLAGVYTATMLYWLDDRTLGATATEAFFARRLNEVLTLTRLRERLSHIPTPFGVLRALRPRGV